MQTDRRTRDRIRLFFWALLTLVCVAAALFARQQQQQGLSRKVEAAQERAIRYTQNALVGRLDADRVSRPIQRSGFDELLKEVKRGLFTDGRVLRLRIWRPDGLLVFTTDDPARVGKLISDDETLASAIGGQIVSRVRSESFAPDTVTTPTRTDLLATYVPMRVNESARVYGVVEVDSDYGLLRATSSKPWLQLGVAFGLLAILTAVMTILSFIWSRRAEEVAGFGPSRRDVRAAARDDKRVARAEAETAELRTRVAELEERLKSTSVAETELEKVRTRVVELERPVAEATAVPADVEELAQRAARFEEQAVSAEALVAQLQARVIEMEAQLRLSADQLRSANKRLEGVGTIPDEIQEKLQSGEERERHLSTELRAQRAEVESLRAALTEAQAAHAEEAQEQRGQLDEMRVQARIAEEERQRILAEAAKSPTAEPLVAPDAQLRIGELEDALKRSEHERAMLRAGRPETVYEARNRELEDEIAELKGRMAEAEARARAADARSAGVDPGVIARLEERIAAAEQRAHAAEERPNGSRSRSRASKTNGGADTADDGEPVQDVDEPPVDGSELRSRLVRSTDARRRGAAPTSDR